MIKLFTNGSLELPTPRTYQPTPDYNDADGDFMDDDLTPSPYLLYTLGEVRERQLIPALKIMIERQSFGASQAVRALGEIGDASVGPFLLSKFSCEEAEYGAALGMLKYRHAVAYLTNCLDAGKGDSIEMLHDLLAIGDPSAAPSIERFVNSLPENASKSRRIAECVLVQLREGNASAVLVSMLDAEKDEHEKIEMIRELGLYHDQRAIDKLFEIAVSSEHTLLRGNAIWTLGAMKDKKALLALISVLSTNAPPPADFDKLAILADGLRTIHAWRQPRHCIILHGRILIMMR